MPKIPRPTRHSCRGKIRLRLDVTLLVMEEHAKLILMEVLYEYVSDWQGDSY